MKKLFLTLLFLGLAPVLLAQIQPSPAVSVAEAQAKVWDVGQKLNTAIYNLNTAKLDWQRNKLSDALTDARQKGDTISINQLQSKIAEIDHRKDLEKQKLDLNNQLILAKQQGDNGKADEILFQLKSLQ